MFDVGRLFGKEDIEVTPIFGANGLVSPGITWQVENPVSLMERYAE